MDFKIANLEAIQLLKDIITIPSYSRLETEKADFLQQYIEEKGYTTGRKDNNVWIFGSAFSLEIGRA